MENNYKTIFIGGSLGYTCQKCGFQPEAVFDKANETQGDIVYVSGEKITKCPSCGENYV